MAIKKRNTHTRQGGLAFGKWRRRSAWSGASHRRDCRALLIFNRLNASHLCVVCLRVVADRIHFFRRQSSDHDRRPVVVTTAHKHGADPVKIVCTPVQGWVLLVRRMANSFALARSIARKRLASRYEQHLRNMQGLHLHT